MFVTGAGLLLTSAPSTHCGLERAAVVAPHTASAAASSHCLQSSSAARMAAAGCARSCTVGCSAAGGLAEAHDPKLAAMLCRKSGSMAGRSVMVTERAPSLRRRRCCCCHSAGSPPPADWPERAPPERGEGSAGEHCRRWWAAPGRGHPHQTEPAPDLDDSRASQAVARPPPVEVGDHQPAPVPQNVTADPVGVDLPVRSPPR